MVVENIIGDEAILESMIGDDNIFKNITGGDDILIIMFLMFLII